MEIDKVSEEIASMPWLNVIVKYSSEIDNLIKGEFSDEPSSVLKKKVIIQKDKNIPREQVF